MIYTCVHVPYIYEYKYYRWCLITLLAVIQSCSWRCCGPKKQNMKTYTSFLSLHTTILACFLLVQFSYDTNIFGDPTEICITEVLLHIYIYIYRKTKCFSKFPKCEYLSHCLKFNVFGQASNAFAEISSLLLCYAVDLCVSYTTNGRSDAARSENTVHVGRMDQWYYLTTNCITKCTIFLPNNNTWYHNSIARNFPPLALSHMTADSFWINSKTVLDCKHWEICTASESEWPSRLAESSVYPVLRFTANSFICENVRNSAVGSAQFRREVFTKEIFACKHITFLRKVHSAHRLKCNIETFRNMSSRRNHSISPHYVTTNLANNGTDAQSYAYI